jgi:hypothetical protein
VSLFRWLRRGAAAGKQASVWVQVRIRPTENSAAAIIS